VWRTSFGRGYGPVVRQSIHFHVHLCTHTWKSLHPLCSWSGYGPGGKKEHEKICTVELHNFYPSLHIINIIKSKHIYVVFPDTVLRHTLRELMEWFEKHVATLITVIPVSNLGLRLALWLILPFRSSGTLCLRRNWSRRLLAELLHKSTFTTTIRAYLKRRNCP
jgi:hypothetical protein